MSDVNVVSYRPERSDYVWTFGGAEPVMKVKPGDVLELWTDDCFTGLIQGADDLVSDKIRFPFLNPQTGPFFVEGAEPGDTLALHFVSIEPSRDWGVSTTVPLFGALTSTLATVTLQDPLDEVVWLYEVDRERRTVRYEARRGDHRVELPLETMHGTVGVAPPNLEVRLALVPGPHGGNMDSPEVRAGTTCYLGVNVEGGLFSIGDGHYRQGEGETCGVAVEGAMDTVLIVDVIKDRLTAWPRFEDDTHIMSTGSARPLEDAFRIAHGDMVAWLVEEFAMEKLDAYQLLTQISESPVANVCDPNYTFVVKAAKAYLPTGEAYLGVRRRLNEVAAGFRSARGTSSFPTNGH
jgi:acetamidase/formamidase